ncbi:MAG: cation:proton antiporter [Patescibacteria group bacterium]
MPALFFELAIVLVLSTILGIVFRALKQPLILAYITAGIIISLSGLFGEVDYAAFDLLSSIGIAFLLFLIGVELKLSDLKYMGRSALYLGLGQIAFTAIVGFVLVSALGFSQIASIYMAIAISFSSTVIIIKLLSEKHDLQSLYGKIAIGYLLVQDFVAIGALMILSAFGDSGAPTAGVLMGIMVKGFLLVGLAYIASKSILKFLFSLTSPSTELLFVSAIAWSFLLSSVAALFGFSIAIGAFLAGVAIASSPYRIQISARIKPVRDFFIIIFFILLGASMSAGATTVLVSQILLLSAFVLLGKPLIMLAIMLTLGFKNRTAFLSSVTGAQISEFSLILLSSGVTIGHVPQQALALFAGVGIVTITLSSYLILYGDRLWRFVAGPMKRAFPEKPGEPLVANRDQLSDHFILVGAEQMGWDILEYLSNKMHSKKQIVVVDFNPETIKTLAASGYNAVFGDISDPELAQELVLERAKVLVSTVPDAADTAYLVRMVRDHNFHGPIIVTSYWMHDAVKLYEMGADYVVVPEEVGGQHVAKILSEHWDNLGKIKKSRHKHFDELLSHKIF